MGYSSMWRGSRAARQAARGEEEDPENRRPTLNGTGGEKHVALWEGTGLGEEAKSCVTPRSPESTPSGSIPFPLRARSESTGSS